MATAELVNDIIRNRRSSFVRQFVQGKTIPKDIINEILVNANTAPTHKFTEPWRFCVFSGEGLKMLAEKQAEIYKENAGPAFKQNKYEQMLTNPLQCSHIISIGCKRNPNQLPEMEEIAAVACAVQNIYLSLDAYGIGGYWSTGGITFMPEAKEFFGLGDDDILMGFFYLGYLEVKSPARKSGALEPKITWYD